MNWPPEKRWTYIRRRADRHGIARWQGSNYNSLHGLTEEQVETALPSRHLALWGARHHGMRVVSVEPRGLLRRLWHLKPQGEKQL